MSRDHGPIVLAFSIVWLALRAAVRQGLRNLGRFARSAVARLQ